MVENAAMHRSAAGADATSNAAVGHLSGEDATSAAGKGNDEPRRGDGGLGVVHINADGGGGEASAAAGGDAGADATSKAAGGESSKAAGEDATSAAGKESDKPRRRRDDGGLGVVRIKPLGSGGGGGEASAVVATRDGAPLPPSVQYTARSVTIDGRVFKYPRHVISPEMDQRALYDEFMPRRVAAFLDGVNVNVMAYGQTGSGKTHTMFGPPGMMARAAQGAFGAAVADDYGLFPRGLLAIIDAARARHGARAVLTASAVELSITGNLDMMTKSERLPKAMVRMMATARARRVDIRARALSRSLRVCARRTPAGAAPRRWASRSTGRRGRRSYTARRSCRSRATPTCCASSARSRRATRRARE